MNLYLTLEAIKCLVNDQRHRGFNPHAIGSLVKEFMPHLSYSDLACICQVKRYLYEGEDCVINLLINLRPDFLDGIADNPPPTMEEIEKSAELRSQTAIAA